MNLRQIDALVAEEIMGLGPIKYTEAITGVYLNDNGETTTSTAEDFCIINDRGPSATISTVPSYSSDIRAAMDVWHELRESGKFCCLEIDSDFHYVWGVKLTYAQWKEGEWVEDDKHEPHIHIENSRSGLESLALCICVAALMTVDIDKVKECKLVDLVKIRRDRRGR